jgi:small GTP-binding protein
MGKGFQGSYMKTIGADFASHKTEIQDHQVTYQIFDLAGQDAYTIARKSFYKGGQAAFLIFDLQDPNSLHNLKTWITDSIENSNASIGTFVVLGNKADLVDTRQVSNEMAIEYCHRLSAETGLTFVFLETSAKTGLNISLAFDIMGNRLLRKHNIDVSLDLPEGTTLIKPGSSVENSNVNTETVTAAAVTAATEAVTEASTDQLDVLVDRLSGIEERLDGLEKRFGKLAQIVRGLVDK